MEQLHQARIRLRQEGGEGKVDSPTEGEPEQEGDENGALTIAEVEEEIEACQMQLEYKDEKILEMEQLANGEMGCSDALMHQFETATLPEARTMLTALFSRMSSAQTDSRKHADGFVTLQIQHAELQSSAIESEHRLQLARMEFDRQLTKVQADHETKLGLFIEHFKGTYEEQQQKQQKAEGFVRTPLGDEDDEDTSMEPSEPPPSYCPPPSLEPPPSRAKVLLQMATEKEKLMAQQIAQLSQSRSDMEEQV
jgi:hypothetical protein